MFRGNVGCNFILKLQFTLPTLRVLFHKTLRIYVRGGLKRDSLILRKPERYP